MYKIVGVSFFNSNRVYYFNPDGNEIQKDSHVIVETEKGLQYGITCTEIEECDETKLVLPLKRVIRNATEKDKEVQERNTITSKKAFDDAKRLAKELNLEMNFINASLTFDRTQLLLNFFADERIDFRELAKSLASIYKTRIELRQIGVRDKAKKVGGLGPCGRVLCCNAFLNDFDSVTINMAKNQFIALNPTKINGVCGRLLCCLTYEDALYTDLKKDFLNVGSYIKYKNVKYKIIGVNIFKKSYTVENEDKAIMELLAEDYEANK